MLARGLLVSAAMRKHFGSSQLVVAIWVVNIVSAWAIAAHALLGSA